MFCKTHMILSSAAALPLPILSIIRYNILQTVNRSTPAKS